MNETCNCVDRRTNGKERTKKMIKVILWDVDGTLLDFKKSEYAAIKKCFEIFGLGECSDEMIARYSVINRGYWEKLERGEITKQEVLENRFMDFFEKENIQTDCAEGFNKEYQMQLGETVCFCDNSYELLKSLKGRVKQYAVTNGTKQAQDRKLSKSGLIDIFDGVFISEEVGCEKPGIEFFEHVWEQIGLYEKEEVMIVGDSLTSDIQGGNNAGIVCCWYNPEGMKNETDLRIDYEIDDLQKILEFVTG